MKKIMLFFIIIILSIQPVTLVSAESNNHLKASYIKNNDLWIKIHNHEMRITTSQYIRFPKWSYDGEWIAYLKGNKEAESPLFNGELWLYNVNLNKHYKVSSNVTRNFKWAPNQNLLGFQNDELLKMIDTNSIMEQHKISPRIIDFSWLPDGKGFLTSSKAGKSVYSDILLTKFILKNNNQMKKQPFYTIKVRENDYFYGTSQFKWSKDHKWIAFQLVPTASLSADSNTLAVLSNDGRNFYKIDEMLNYDDWFQWAPSINSIAYIQGTSRFSLKNKSLKIKTMFNHSNYSLTPKGFVDRDLTWKTNNQIFVSRSAESDWAVESNRPMPSIYHINLQINKQMRITFPTKNEGDFFSISDNYRKNLIWIRTNRKQACVFMSTIDGLNQRKWINKIDLGSWYYEHWNWDEVFSLYQL